jgi:hypothetical protein
MNLMSSTGWANIGEDAGAPHALLARVAEHVPIARMDQLWIFPPRRIAAGESTVVVVGAFDDDDRRRVITARFTVLRNRRGDAAVSAAFDEHGTALKAAIPRIIQGVLRRLGEDPAAEPQHVAISGQRQRWDALIVELGGRPLPDPPQRHDDTMSDVASSSSDDVAATGPADVSLGATAGNPGAAADADTTSRGS